MSSHKRNNCRVCGADHLECVLALGNMPLANSFLQNSAEFNDEPHYPLDVFFCMNCAALQLLEVVAPETLFRHYLYVTGTSDTIAAHNRAYAQTVVDLLAMNADDLVVEVASNDGSLLTCFQQHGVRTLGIDPAVNVAAIAQANGIDTIAEFFDIDLARRLRAQSGPAKAVIGNNVLAHVDEPISFLAGFRHLLAAGGHAILEFPYLGNMLAGMEYDTVYHEHLSYFSVNTLLRLFEGAEMRIVRIDQVKVHGGSLRVYAVDSAEISDHAPTVLAWAAQEQRNGFTDVATYRRFAQKVAQSRSDLLDLLHNLRAQGKIIAGYGASAKGNTLLNYCGIDSSLMPVVFDKNDLKVGLMTPGTHIPVYPATDLGDHQPDYLLILAWNFADEIMRQQQAYHDNGGKFIIPIPDLKVV
jgi:SAM-dependent methyltransferase